MYNSIIHYLIYADIQEHTRICTPMSIWLSLNKSCYSGLNEKKYKDLSYSRPAWGEELFIARAYPTRKNSFI